MKNQINQEAVTILNDLKATAITQACHVTTALRTVKDRIPNITRVEFRHSAEAVGINGLTARNVFDRLSRD